MQDKQIAIIGLEDFNRELLEATANADDYRFHGLIAYNQIVNPASYAAKDLLHDARNDMGDVAGGVDAIIAHWDFPSTTLLPILQREKGLTGACLEAMLRCENKYATRNAQAQTVPELTPPFALVDPDSDSVLDDPPLAYPFWLKPVVAFSSTLGFMVNDRDDFWNALSQIRKGIGKFAEPYDELLRYARLGSERALMAGRYCIAEGLIGGRGCTAEGYIVDGQPRVYGIVDSLRWFDGLSFMGYLYPSQLPGEIQDRIIESTGRMIRGIGLDDTAFNVEFFWDEDSDDIKVLEVNARISKSHSPLFQMVEGASHHEVPIDVALGRTPSFPRGKGPYAHAAKFMPRVFDDARVTRVPSDADVARLRESFPDVQFICHVGKGMQLADLPNQDSYSYELADLFLGGSSRDELLESFPEAMRVLGFRFSRSVQTNYD